jgi:hypothetical protein
MIDDVQWFVGIDWATQSHRVCLLDIEGRHVSCALSRPSRISAVTILRCREIGA